MNNRLKQLLASVAAVAIVFACAPANAAEISVAALFTGKAVLVIDGGKPRTLSVGDVTGEGVRLLSASSEAAVIEFNGQRRTLTVGEGTRLGAGGGFASGGSGKTTLTADSRGQFYTDGSINGISVRFMVDTGATTVALSTDEARRLGINYLAGDKGHARTAGGIVPMYRVRLDNVRVGSITLSNVEAAVTDGMKGMSYALLGMSFLNRTQMMRDGDTLTLVRRF